MSNSLQVKSIVFLNITDLSEVQLCMSSNSWTWECPHTKDGADHVPLIFVSSVYKYIPTGFFAQYKKEVSDDFLNVSWVIGHEPYQLIAYATTFLW